MSWYAPGSYSVPVYGITALYFSIVTFTSGIGDISPLSDISKLVTSLEILISWIVITVVIAATVSWVLEHHRRRSEQAVVKGEVHMRATEEALRILRMGMYSEHTDVGGSSAGHESGEDPDEGPAA